MDHLTVDGTSYVNKTGSLLGVNEEANGHKLTVFYLLDKRGGNEADINAVLKFRDFLYNHDSYEATEASFYLRPSTAPESGTIEIYNIGFYTIGDILDAYSDLSSTKWAIWKSQLGEWTKLNASAYEGGFGAPSWKDGKESLVYNYLRCKSLGTLPASYTMIEAKNINLSDSETTPLKKDAFDGIGMGITNILLSDAVYKLMPTLNQHVSIVNSIYTAYKDGVNPAKIQATEDGTKASSLYSYTRNFKAGNNSCVLPFDVNAEDLTAIGLTAYEFVSYTNGNVNFKAAEGIIAAGTPLMVKAEREGLYLIPAAETPNLLSDISGYKEAMDVQGNKFVGSFVNEVPATYNNRYGLDKNASSFVAMGEAHTTYYRAFLSLKDNSAEAKPLTLSFDGETTGISQVNAEKVADDAYYNLQGVKMNPNHLPHGIYIHQGKKVIK